MLQKDVILELPSSLSSVAELDAFVNDLIERHGLNEDVHGKLLVSLTEAVTNAIRHGNQFDANKCVRVEVYRDKNELKVMVIDEGRGFEPDNVPDPTTEEALEKEGGRGVFLMKLLADKIAFHNEGRAVEMCYSCICATDTGASAASASNVATA